MASADQKLPEILAPAGDRDCFLAALAAGADGIYLGLKNFSARMEAENFGLGELARLVELAQTHHCRVYVAMNSMLRQPELAQAYRLVRRLAAQVKPAGLIIQDLAMLDLARQAGFEGLLALSTLANVCDQAAFKAVKALGADRVIIPRELSIDEMRLMGEACPPGLELECFVHGALCYCVSGRCYWSSYLGGKSGLRGRCVQPCRRNYARARRNGSREQKPSRSGERLFSCQDLELLPVVRQLLTVPNLVSWKIEGRKKGPHYVYHVVTAYKILRDCGEDSQQRKLAQEILGQALGRPGGRARFLPQRPQQPMAPHGQTGSGLLAGKINILQDGSCVMRAHVDLLPQDFLRIGTEDEKWHATMRISRKLPKGATQPLKLPAHKTPKAGTPVYLIDRREPELQTILKTWRAKLEAMPEVAISAVDTAPVLPAVKQGRAVPDMLVLSKPATGKLQGRGRYPSQGIWLTPRNAEISRTLYSRIFFWLPPAIFPEAEKTYKGLIERLWRSGCRNFVCNTPWQRGYFPEEAGEATLVAGPFCNLANSLALQEAAELGFCAAFVSPELSGRDLLALPSVSPLPLGMVIGGFWPVGMSRFGLAGLEAGDGFVSPRGEGFWSRNLAGMSWIYPDWQLDLGEKRQELVAAGYSFFAWLEETPPHGSRHRPGLFNWDGKLL